MMAKGKERSEMRKKGSEKKDWEGRQGTGRNDKTKHEMIMMLTRRKKRKRRW